MSLSADSAQSLYGELRERRVQIVHTLIKASKFEQAIPHLERLLEGGVNQDDNRSSSFARLLVRARYETGCGRAELTELFDRFPSLKSYLEEIQLEHAQQLLDRNEFMKVVETLPEYRLRGFTDPLENDWGSVLTVAKLRIILASALLWSKDFTSVPEVDYIPMLEWVLLRPNLDPLQMRTAHGLMAEAGTPSQAKTHGMQSVQISLDHFGRDHESTVASMLFMVHLCSEAGDPDESLWRDMLPADTRQAIGSVSEGMDSLLACRLFMRTLAPLFKYTAAKIGWTYLMSSFVLPSQKPMPSPCWSCVGRHLLHSGGSSLLAFIPGVTCGLSHHVSKTGGCLQPQSCKL